MATELEHAQSGHFARVEARENMEQPQVADAPSEASATSRVQEMETQGDESSHRGQAREHAKGEGDH